MLVTLLGSLMCVKPEHPLKASSSMRVTKPGTIRVDRLVHPLFLLRIDYQRNAYIKVEK